MAKNKYFTDESLAFFVGKIKEYTNTEMSSIVTHDELTNEQIDAIIGPLEDNSGSTLAPDIITDGTLTQSGMAADAKVVGDRLTAIESSIPENALIVTFTVTGQSGTTITGNSDKTHLEVLEAVNSGRQVYAHIPSMNDAFIPVTSCASTVANFGGITFYNAPVALKSELIGTTVKTEMYPMIPAVTEYDAGKIVMVSSVGELIFSNMLTDEHINSLIDTKLGVIENGSY